MKTRKLTAADATWLMHAKERHAARERLFRAVQKYVETRGGSVAVAGGIAITRDPGDRPLNWNICIRCTGKPPKHLP